MKRRATYTEEGKALYRSKCPCGWAETRMRASEKGMFFEYERCRCGNSPMAFYAVGEKEEREKRE